MQGRTNGGTLDEYFAASQRRDNARAQILAIAHKLQNMASLLQTPENVRVNERVTLRVSRSIPYTLDESEVPSWPQIADALRNFLHADDDFLSMESKLSPEQRRQISH